MAVCFAVIAGLSSCGQRRPQLVAAGFLFFIQHVLRPRVGRRSVLVLGRDRTFALQSLGQRHRQRRQLDLLLRGRHDHSARDGESWLEDLYVSLKHYRLGQSIWKVLLTYIRCSIFAIFNAVFVPIIYFFLVETKQRSLEELDVIFASGGDPVRKEKIMPHDLSVAESRRILGLDVDDNSSEEDLKTVNVGIEKV